MLALIVFVERPLQDKRARAASRFVLPGLAPDSVTNIELTPSGSRSIRAERSAAGAHDWRLTQPVNYSAAAEPIEALLTALSQLQWEDRIDASELLRKPNASEAYGLARPQYSIELGGTGGGRHLEIGANTALGDQLFVQVVGSYDVYLVGVALTNAIPVSKDYWRNTALVDDPHLPYDTVQVRSMGKSFEASRNPATQLWELKKPVQARADSAKIDQLLVRLGEMRVTGFAADDSAIDLERVGLQWPSQAPQLELALLRNTNVLFDLQVGSNSFTVAGCAFARRQDPTNVVLIPTSPLLPWEADSTNFLDRHIFSLPPSQIDAIDVVGDDHFVALRQPDNSWQVSVTNRVFPADAILMKDWLSAFTNISLAIEKMVVADLVPYGLDKPRLVYKLQGSGAGSNQLLAQVQFGSARDGAVFECRQDESSVNLIDGADFDRLPRASWQLRDRGVWDFAGSNVVSVTVHQFGADRKYLRDPSGEWTLAPGYHGPVFPNIFQAEEGLYRLGQLRAIYWDGIGDDPTDKFGFKAADHRITLEVRNGDGADTYQIEFGHRSPYRHAYAAVVKDGQRLIFECPVDLYDGFILTQFTLPSALRENP